MDQEHARQLLAAERHRLELAIDTRDGGDLQADAEADEPGGRDSGDLYEKELGLGLAADLAGALAAVERAEQRLAEGTYGLSVQSGEPIPDDRLEALPSAELTVEEQRALGA